MGCIFFKPKNPVSPISYSNSIEFSGNHSNVCTDFREIKQFIDNIHAESKFSLETKDIIRKFKYHYGYIMSLLETDQKQTFPQAQKTWCSSGEKILSNALVLSANKMEKNKITHRKAELQQMLGEKDLKISKQEEYIEKLHKEISQTQLDLKMRQREVKDLSDRLATEMSKKISSNESAVENVSIRNRPMNIADDYQLLCSNEWLMAKTCLDELCESSVEEDKLRLLNNILLISEKEARKIHDVVIQTTDEYLRKLPIYQPITFACQGTGKKETIAELEEKGERSAKPPDLMQMDVESTHDDHSAQEAKVEEKAETKKEGRSEDANKGATAPISRQKKKKGKEHKKERKHKQESTTEESNSGHRNKKPKITEDVSNSKDDTTKNKEEESTTEESNFGHLNRKTNITEHTSNPKDDTTTNKEQESTTEESNFGHLNRKTNITEHTSNPKDDTIKNKEQESTTEESNFGHLNRKTNITEHTSNPKDDTNKNKEEENQEKESKPSKSKRYEVSPDHGIREIPLQFSNAVRDTLRENADNIEMNGMIKIVRSQLANTKESKLKKLWKAVQNEAALTEYISVTVSVAWKMVIQIPRMSLQMPGVNESWKGDKYQDVLWDSHNPSNPRSRVLCYAYPMLYQGATLMAKGKVLVRVPDPDLIVADYISGDEDN